eukprot:TRINITY_DN43545_c0_g1_i1.p1 TRINITY_DN43545_c0_g1~~TRINITY_DN43545_c0_g1_i1.p1  ORF type:complete len:522 (-),score=100.61 TRINITY_DN43545_c0_g1_i1:28-1593(-)
MAAAAAASSTEDPKLLSLQRGVEAVEKAMSSEMQFVNEKEEAFALFRRGCRHCAQLPAFLDAVGPKDTIVMFLARVATRRATVGQVREMVAILRKAPAWHGVLADAPESLRQALGAGARSEDLFPPACSNGEASASTTPLAASSTVPTASTTSLVVTMDPVAPTSSILVAPVPAASSALQAPDPVECALSSPPTPLPEPPPLLAAPAHDDRLFLRECRSQRYLTVFETCSEGPSAGQHQHCILSDLPTSLFVCHRGGVSGAALGMGTSGEDGGGKGEGRSGSDDQHGGTTAGGAGRRSLGCILPFQKTRRPEVSEPAEGRRWGAGSTRAAARDAASGLAGFFRGGGAAGAGAGALAGGYAAKVTSDRVITTERPTDEGEKACDPACLGASVVADAACGAAEQGDASVCEDEDETWGFEHEGLPEFGHFLAPRRWHGPQRQCNLVAADVGGIVTMQQPRDELCCLSECFGKSEAFKWHCSGTGGATIQHVASGHWLYVDGSMPDRVLLHATEKSPWEALPPI